MTGGSTSTISVVDYGVVNLGAIRNMFRKLGFDVEFVSTPAAVSAARKIVLPGVGAFDHGVNALTELGLIDALRSKVAGDETPILGICLGMQLLCKSSEEGTREGLGLVDGACVRFRLPDDSGLKVPHMGWNEPVPKRGNPLLSGLDNRARFYFTHSYHMVCDDPNDVLATAMHGIEFTAIVQHNKVMGVQFHPEKSHRFGMTLLRNFGSM